MVLPAEILKKVKLLEISTRKLVNNLFAGEYQTVFKGQGMTFADFREYVPGDDVRTISWPLTARTGKPFIKKFEEEREMTLMLAVDCSGSSDFGSGKYFKGETMTHLAALLAFSAAKNKDHVGLILFSDQVEHFVPPGKGVGHVHRILRDLLFFKPKSRLTKLSACLSHLSMILKKRSVVFIMSDFEDEGFDSALRLLGRKHEVVAVVVQDALEQKLPAIGMVELQDAETGEMLMVDTSSAAFQADFARYRKEREDQRDRMLRLSQVDRVDVKSSESAVDALINYFQKRRSR